MDKRKFLFFGLCLALLFACSNDEELIDNKVFEAMPSSVTGIEFSNDLTESHALNYFTYSYLYMGGGVAAGDINNDGLIDIYFTGNQVSNKLYLNKGNLQFEDVTRKAGVGGDGRWYTGVTMADVNSDGLLDIYCSVSGKFLPRDNQLFINNGDGTFSEKASEYGIADKGSTIQSTYFDYDKDGDLDLYVGNYPPARFNSPNVYYLHKMKNHTYNEVDHLYRNDGGKFTDVSVESGIAQYGLTLGTTVGDLNNDGWPDIYISNDFSTPDYLYLNNGDGTFKNVLRESTFHTAFYGMGVDIADINNDGYLDIYQPDMDSHINRRQKANMVSMDPELFWSTVQSGFHYQYMHNCLQINAGYLEDNIPHFSNIARMAGVSSTDWTWGGVFADFDNDGNKDLFVSNGTRREVSNHDYFSDLKSVRRDEFLGLSVNMPSERIDNFMFRNNGNMIFEKMNDEWDIKFEGFSTGAIYADLDNDGDLEIITNNLDDKASIFRNKSVVINNYLTVQFEGEKNNKFGLGNKVYLKSDGQTQFQEMTLSRGFQSSVAPELHFGLGESESIDELKVVWWNGKEQVLKNIKANQKLVIHATDAKAATKTEKSASSKMFISDQQGPFPNFKHQENYNDDFLTQVLLPHKMSTFGPALAVGDLNEDGMDDYFVGGSSGHTATIFFQEGKGFKEQNISVFEKDKVSEDIGAVIFDADMDGDNDLYVVSGGYEFSPTSKLLQDRLYINQGKGTFVKATSHVLPNMLTSGSKVYAEDFNKDGKQDLLVLGRQIPGNYPNSANSYLLKNVGEKGKPKFKYYSENAIHLLENLGMATSASITDFDGDGWKDIIVAGEWMPIRVFKNNQGDFVEVSESMGLTEDTRGWWWSIQQGDFDNDGDMDYVLGNNGLNYKYKAKEDETFDIYFNDFDENGKGDIVLGYYNQGEQYPVRGRECSSQQIPGIKDKFKNYESFSTATLQEVYGQDQLEKSMHYKIKSFASIYLENKDGRFVSHELPIEAQMSSINQFLVQDYNKDGNLDLLIAGNLHASEVETPRNDAGYGLFLKGDGLGGFVSIPAYESGFFASGDVKDMATIEVGEESYVVVAKNNDYLQYIKVTD
ncbi:MULTISPECIES: VCBS repeat-containing protein [Flavobacteriaceae]|uniref:VCBS repeat-containing protein n=1 Tax=Flavobacteriaceae TaxID=49546 RepID=UPI001492D47D|nr:MULTISPECIES: VCBS repeat-containing protein [Allomuricauda]MDC6365868.1 VCBS repeat-containing protein [Muricauda sp. AC10]